MQALSTLCYIEKDNKYLMLHRVKKDHDVNHGKWIGVGGHFLPGESPEECLVREVKEETGYTLTSYRFRGIVTFVYGVKPDAHPSVETARNTETANAADPDLITEYMHLYTADEFTGEEIPCDEGDLAWVDIDKITDLPLWEGDRVFLELLAEDEPFFSLKLVYDKQDNLIERVLNGTALR